MLVVQITMNMWWRLRNLPGFIPRPASVQRDCVWIEFIINWYPAACCRAVHFRLSR